jgi:glycogen debranching enzyme
LGTRFDSFTEEEPGRTKHEKGKGEGGRLRMHPFGQFYGNSDGTPDLLDLIWQYVLWTGDKDLVRKLQVPVSQMAWWLQYHLKSNDWGFIAYAPCHPEHVHHHMWMDDADAARDKRGKRAEYPIATGEIQAAGWRACLALAHMYEILGLRELAQQWLIEASQIQVRFQSQFWNADQGIPLFAISGKDKNRCPQATVNAGLVLESGILLPEQAKSVMDRLRMPDLFVEGVGIRTLSSLDPAFNPQKYQQGAVWPHATARAAMGYSRYGDKQFAAKLCFAALNIARHDQYCRVPEKVSGNDTMEGFGPAPDPQASKWQAWSLASLYQCIQASVGIECSSEGIVIKSPYLPEKVGGWVEVTVYYKQEPCTIRFEGSGEEVKIIPLTGNVKI